ncbi:MAG: SsrA-binding protein [Candidatus Taylorbacteria bacterium]|nr:SsrA-binding protein [Candidatus Taylorbacteria bacterium]
MGYASNPKAGFDYEILETVEAGIVLEGHEVKSIKTGKASIKGSYVKILHPVRSLARAKSASPKDLGEATSNGVNEEPFLIGAIIAPYQPANTPKNYDPQRSRKLLLSKKEISKLIGLSQSQGLTLIPLKFYSKKGLIKLLVGIARGKKKYDKRETIKKKDVARAKQRGLER